METAPHLPARAACRRPWPKRVSVVSTRNRACPSCLLMSVSSSIGTCKPTVRRGLVSTPPAPRAAPGLPLAARAPWWRPAGRPGAETWGVLTCGAGGGRGASPEPRAFRVGTGAERGESVQGRPVREGTRPHGRSDHRPGSAAPSLPFPSHTRSVCHRLPLVPQPPCNTATHGPFKRAGGPCRPREPAPQTPDPDTGHLPSPSMR